MVITGRHNNTSDITTSSSESGTLSGQTETSDLNSSLGSQDKCLAVETISSGNGGDEDDDEYTDDDEDEDDDEVRMTTSKTTFETASDSSSYKVKPTPSKKIKTILSSTGNGRVNRDKGDTGSSSSANHMANTPKYVPPVAKPIIAVDDSELSRLVDSLRSQLVREQQEATLNKHAIIHEARETIARNKSEEAWTAQQTVTQIEAAVELEAERKATQVVKLIETSAKAEVDKKDIKVSEIETAAQMHIEHTQRIAQEEARIAEEHKRAASATAQAKSEKDKEVEHLKELLRSAELNINHLGSTANAYKTEMEKMSRAFEETRMQALADSQRKEEEFFRRMQQMQEDHQRDIERRRNVAAAASTTDLSIRDLGFLVERFIGTQMETNKRMEAAIHGRTQYFEMDDDEIPAPPVLKATRTATTRSRSETATRGRDRERRDRGGDEEPNKDPNPNRSGRDRDNYFGMPNGRGPPDDDDDDHHSDDDDEEERKKDKKKKSRKGKDDNPDFDPDDDDDHPSGSDDHAPNPKRNPRVTTKEADVIKLLPLPDKAGKFRAWKLSTRRKIIAASADPARAYPWIKEVENRLKGFDEFRSSGDFSTLDTKLGSALSDLAKGELGRRLTLATEKEDKDGRNVTGRQLLKVVYDYYKTDEYSGVLYDVADLMEVKVKGDNPGWKQLQDFRDTWDETLAGMEKEPATDILEALFKQKVRVCSCIAHDISIYDRAEKGSAEKSYQYLYEAVEKFLSRKISEVNRADVQRTIKHGGSDKNDNHNRNNRGRSKERTATPAPTTGKGKKNKKNPRGNSRASSKGGRGGSADGNRRRINGKQKNVCYSWKNTGKCAKHEKGECNYTHDEEDRASSKGGSRSGSPGSNRSKSGSRKGGKKGRGKGKAKGKRDPTPPAKDRGSIACYFFLRSRCSKGTDCEYKHDSSDLEKFKKNAKDFS